VVIPVEIALVTDILVVIGSNDDRANSVVTGSDDGRVNLAVIGLIDDLVTLVVTVLVGNRVNPIFGEQMKPAVKPTVGWMNVATLLVD
jgi:hypothetical protein